MNEEALLQQVAQDIAEFLIAHPQQTPVVFEDLQELLK